MGILTLIFMILGVAAVVLFAVIWLTPMTPEETITTGYCNHLNDIHPKLDCLDAKLYELEQRLAQYEDITGERMMNMTDLMIKANEHLEAIRYNQTGQ